MVELACLLHSQPKSLSLHRGDTSLCFLFKISDALLGMWKKHTECLVLFRAVIRGIRGSRVLEMIGLS